MRSVLRSKDVIKAQLIDNRGGSLDIDLARISEFMGPLVYEFRKGQKVLYVGRSLRGIYRPFDPSHHMRILRRSSDRIVIHFCPSDGAATHLEQILIARYMPIGNKETVAERKLQKAII
jgi:hypothetical protein